MRLPTLLVIVNVALIGVIVLGVGVVTRTLVMGFADEQGLARVTQSVHIARNNIAQAAATFVADPPRNLPKVSTASRRTPGCSG